MLKLLLLAAARAARRAAFEGLRVPYSCPARSKDASACLQLSLAPPGWRLALKAALGKLGACQEIAHRISDFVIEKRVLECTAVTKPSEYMGRAKREGIDTMFKCQN